MNNFKIPIRDSNQIWKKKYIAMKLYQTYFAGSFVDSMPSDLIIHHPEEKKGMSVCWSGVTSCIVNNNSMTELPIR